MANSDKKIVITPNTGSSSANPNIVFSGADASLGPQNITMTVYPANGGTLSVDGSNGQLFSISNVLTGTLFSVNDISGIPSIEVLDTGVVKLAQYGGSVLIGTESNTATYRMVIAHSGASTNGVRIIDTSAGGGTPNNMHVDYVGAAPNNTSARPYVFSDTNSVKFIVYSNGGIANVSANNQSLSDRREKTNFAPARDYLDVICSIPVQTFNFIDQPEDDPGTTLGVVAQDVQAVAPELVTETNWGTAEEPKMRLSIYQTDLQYALMKSIQEQQALIQAMTARIEALEAQLAAK